LLCALNVWVGYLSAEFINGINALLQKVHKYSYTTELLQLSDLFLTQHVNFPTRARGTDTPHLLDLVFTDDSIVH